MIEIINNPQNIDTNEAITLMQNINVHMSAMFDKAVFALEALAVTHDNFDKKMVEIIGAKPEGGDIKPKTINVGNVRDATDPLSCDENIWSKDLRAFLAADVKDLISSDSPGLQLFMSIGIRYYFERLRDKNFFIMSDLPEMLSVDRKMNELITVCIVTAATLPDGISEIKRKHNLRLGKKKGPADAWLRVKKALVDLNNDPNQRSKKWAISAIANEIHKKVGCTPNTVNLYFKDHFGENVTGKKNSKKNYYISDLINMIDNQ